MRKRFPGEMTVLGGFEMTSQTMRVSDPCYDRDVWCCGTFGKCKTGTWEAGVLKTDMGDWGVRLCRPGSTSQGNWPRLQRDPSEESLSDEGRMVGAADRCGC